MPSDDNDPSRRPLCDICDNESEWWQTTESAVPPLPPPIPPVVPLPAGPVEKDRHLVLLLSALGVLLGFGVVLTAFLQFRSGQERDRSERDRDRITAANQVVAAKVEAAQAHIARRDFDAALNMLDDALATANATKLDDARLWLVRARQGQANALIEAAAAAVAGRKVENARQLLNDYLSHPYADQQARAKTLLDELARASDDDAAMKLLAQLPDDRLTAFAESGRLSDGEPLTDEGMRELYKDTLRRHLPKELAVREARREAARATAKKQERDQALREERLRAAPLFQELTIFAAGVRKQTVEQNKRRQQEERALEEFLRQTNVTDADEREKARQAIRANRDGDDVTVQIVRKKTQLKKDFRQSKDYDRADEETFDLLVDQEADRLLADIKAGR